MTKYWLMLLLQVSCFVQADVIDAYAKRNVTIITPDPIQDNRVEWNVRVITPDSVCRWYRRPGNHHSENITSLYDATLALAVIIVDQDDNQYCYIEGTDIAQQQLSADKLDYSLRLAFVPRPDMTHYVLPYTLEQEHGDMYPSRRIQIAVPEQGDNLFAMDVRVLTVDNICNWYKRLCNHNAQNGSCTLGCWIFNVEKHEYELIVEGSDRSKKQIDDQLLRAGYEHPIKIVYI